MRREARHDRRHEHAAVNAGINQLVYGAQPLCWMRHARFESFPRLLVDRRNADVHTATGARRQVLQHVPVAHDHRAFRHDADRRGGITQGFERAARQFVCALDRLVGVGRGAEADRLPGPRRLVEFAAQHGDEVGLDENDRGEVIARIEFEVRLVPAREAVVASVRAAAIRIQRPLEERHALYPVEGRSAANLLVGGRVAAAPGVG